MRQQELNIWLTLQIKFYKLNWSWQSLHKKKCYKRGLYRDNGKDENNNFFCGDIF
jgi:hypothetical protein